MNKLRSDCKLSSLRRTELETIDQWYFEQKLSHQEVFKRAQEEMRFTGSLSSMKRHYLRRRKDRLADVMFEAGQEADDAARINADPAVFRHAGMKILSRQFFEMTRDAGLNDLPMLAKILLQNEAMQLRREKQELLRQKQLVAVRKWQCDVTRRAWNILPELNKMRGEKELEDEYAENRRLNKMRRSMFGQNIPEPMPESEAEAQAMADAEGKAAGEHAIKCEPHPNLVKQVNQFDQYFYNLSPSAKPNEPKPKEMPREKKDEKIPMTARPAAVPPSTEENAMPNKDEGDSTEPAASPTNPDTKSAEIPATDEPQGSEPDPNENPPPTA